MPGYREAGCIQRRGSICPQSITIGTLGTIDSDSPGFHGCYSVRVWVGPPVGTLYLQGSAIIGEPADVAALHSIIHTLRAELKATTSANPHVPVLHNTSNYDATVRRGRNFATYFDAYRKYGKYWQRFALETLAELARYRGCLMMRGIWRRRSSADKGDRWGNGYIIIVQCIARGQFQRPAKN
ncbi:hypothetical protein P167DRAFT_579316 [Morchella conica CCBAS932]|uniref:Uncharacterized protein n=1 Tax=Morchella conica CCBAS932 TaxID=1392247 RepID=A0A3N4KG87_9PEZI|nr:hypothetical protein P167DRAFT_579316 [Morchella conica CCBAS932]